MKSEGRKVGSFRFDIEAAEEELKEIHAQKVMLQLPEGLKLKAEEFMDLFEEDMMIWGGSCYGACDLPEDIGQADALLHIGHSEIPNLKTDYPIVYLEGRSTRWEKLPEDLYEQIEGKVALYGPVQHLHHLEKAAEELEERGIEPVIGEGDDRIKYPGQVLGCNYSVKVEDAVHHLYIGTGRFHPFGLSFSLRDDVKVYNPVTGELTEIGEEERDDFLRKRFGSITRVEGSERIMVMTSTKKGQRRMKLADEMRELGREAGKEIDVVKFDEIDPVLVDDFRWGCAVNTACPRIALDDNENFRTTILTPNEFKIALGEREWEDWEMDEIH